MAKARNFPKRFKAKSETWSHESGSGRTLSSGMITSREKPMSQTVSPSPRSCATVPNS